MSSDVELLLVILKNHGKIEGRKRFQKIVFLLQKKYGVRMKYKFIPYLYGPYSRAVQTDVDLLNFLGLVSVRPALPYLHMLTRKGLDKAREIEGRMNQPEREKLRCILTEMKGLSTDRLTRAAKAIMQQNLREQN
jgi:uncharacterized protein YwgA